MDERRFYVSFTYQTQPNSQGWGAMTVTLKGPLNEAAITNIRSVIAESRGLTNDMFVIIAFTELETTDA